MKKINLLIAIVALTLSGCMLIQTEKVYKSAEELPDDPIERMKASVSLCKFAGADSSICKDNIVYTNYPSHEVYFYSQKYEGGDFSYLKQSDRVVEASIIAGRACTRNSIAGYCAISGYLENDRLSSLQYLMRACELGDIRSCGVAMDRAYYFKHISEATYDNDEEALQLYGFDQAAFRQRFGGRHKLYDYGKKMFYEAKENFQKLYYTDVWGQRANRLKHYVYAPKSGEKINRSGIKETYSSMNKEAVDMIYEMCNLNISEFCLMVEHSSKVYVAFPFYLRPELLVMEYEDDVLKKDFNFDAYFKKLEDLANMERNRVILIDDERILQNMRERLSYIKEIRSYKY